MCGFSLKTRRTKFFLFENRDRKRSDKILYTVWQKEKQFSNIRIARLRKWGFNFFFVEKAYALCMSFLKKFNRIFVLMFPIFLSGRGEDLITKGLRGSLTFSPHIIHLNLFSFTRWFKWEREDRITENTPKTAENFESFGL